MSDLLSIGIDIGSTWVKAVACTPDGAVAHECRRPTPWQAGHGGTAELSPIVLTGLVHDLLDDLLDVTDAEIDGIGVSGMAEAGVLLAADGTAAAPIIAWFDPRGGTELAATPADFQQAFSGVTGLPVSPLASVGKLLHLRERGIDLARQRWLSVPEFVVHQLGGDIAAEVSLIARTGLLDQETATVWPWALDVLGTPHGFVPEIRTAGSSWGRHARTGATLSVAGHDHLVASIAAGVVEDDQLYDSMGTAEALVRPLSSLLDAPTRTQLAASGLNVVRHMVAGQGVMLAGVKTGLLLRRVLQLVGVHDATGREQLDRAVTALPPGAGRILDVTGARNNDGVLAITADVDGLSPAHLFAATLAHADREVERILELMDAVVAPAHSSVVSGGWSQMLSVQAARRAVLPNPTFSPRSEDTAVGAALVGAFAAQEASDFVAFTRQTHHREITAR
ncbi:FGGY family carbohydrate kinase [Aeromicrobium sp.]|uniref:FGGY family carbohydrate kinase n=1 Tax=Aeromicrobium sp. TaxID=1871063 RepID=UPI002FCBA98B